MASPTVTASATTNGTTSTATPTINLPATVNANDIIVVFIRADNEEAYTWPANWNLLISDASDGSDDQTGCRWKLAVGNEDGTTIQLSRTNSGKFSALAYAIGGANNVEVGSLGTGASTTPDPPNFAPSGGTQDYLWLWMGGWEGEQTSPPAGNPTNYTNPIGANSGTAGAVTTNCRVASARRATTAASENPGTWTISASDDWTAFTMALWFTTPPAPVDAQVQQTLAAIKRSALW